MVKGVRKMTERMKSILSRVLSEEIGNQMRWHKEEKKEGLPAHVINRTEIIEEIKKYMEENKIEVREDFIYKTYYN